ncbi:MAG TPA: hypothetical protein VFU38_08780 [Candidatus Krumholzibacteria bacterium]|nr:hypothetical protein [Candidatus Krumholzibacteria bacterium]
MRKIDWRWLWLAPLVVAACDKPIDGTHVADKPPIVWLAAGPPEGSTGAYSVELFWGGWDPDGEISHYEYLITDNVYGVYDPNASKGRPWTPVLSNDSLFIFTADSLVDNTDPLPQMARFQRSHTFFIRAVDETRLRSTPVHRSFTAETLSPTVEVKIPDKNLKLTPADMPPISTFQWEASDPVDGSDSDQEPDSVQWALVSTEEHGGYRETVDYLSTRESIKDWYPWQWYRAPLDSGKAWTTPPLDFGTYVFAIRAKDEAGAVTPVLEEPVNARRIQIAPRTSGPTLQLQSVFIGRLIASSCDFPVTIADIAANLDISFSLSACAIHYGGTVSGYRYGWDILDLNDPEQWEIDYTPFVGSFATTPPRKWQYGTHAFSAEVIDNSGFCTRIEVKVNIVRFNGERNLLVIDDYDVDEAPGTGWTASGGGIPSDAEHDAFWLDMVSNLDVFDPSRDMIATTIDNEIPLTTLAGYKNFIWSVYGVVNTADFSALPLLYTYIQYKSKNPVSNTESACKATPEGGGKKLPNILALAMQAGVHVMIAGHQPVQNVMPRGTDPPVLLRWPMIPVYELEPGWGQTGTGPKDPDHPPGEHGFAYQDLCLDVIDFGWLDTFRARTAGTGSNRRYCPINGWRTIASTTDQKRDLTMRAAEPLDPSFPRLELRAEAAGSGLFYHASRQGIDAEVYNPDYFRAGGACNYVPEEPRDCFEKIYGLVCLDADERTFNQPVAFWSGAYKDVIAEDIVGAVGARSVVFGFPPVYFEPSQVKPGIEHILFDEWQLPRRPVDSAKN